MKRGRVRSTCIAGRSLLFESVLLDLLERHCCAQVLDPGAGGGGLLLMADDLVRRAKKAQSYHERLPAILGFEIDELLHEECVAEQVPCVLRDALSEESWHVGAMVDEDRSVVVMNPPYSRAQEFVERGDALAFGGVFGKALEAAGGPELFALGFQRLEVEIGHGRSLG